MVWKIDERYGHLVENGDDGSEVYLDDRTPVTKETLRPCFKCSLPCAPGQHDPCIVNLPGTKNACCGHGLASWPDGRPGRGYVALEDGRSFRFSALASAEDIREATALALQEKPLPEGFVYDEQKHWWTGMTQAQYDYVIAGTPAIIRKAVEQVLQGAPLNEAYLQGKALWWTGLSEEQKREVFALLHTSVDELAAEAREKA
ncbi:MAG: hypothetical protein K2W82_17990 [Candidatus Obscuribacterales bacterium]|nr:hypothetical protein [Candidatus Obscuribacterales bacterium]